MILPALDELVAQTNAMQGPDLMVLSIAASVAIIPDEYAASIEDSAYIPTSEQEERYRRRRAAF